MENSVKIKIFFNVILHQLNKGMFTILGCWTEIAFLGSITLASLHKTQSGTGKSGHSAHWGYESQ